MIFLILGSAYCSSSEAAIFSLSKIKLKALAKDGNKQAKTLLQLKEKIRETIGSVVILNNIFNIVGSILIGTLVAEVLYDTNINLNFLSYNLSLGNEFLIAVFSGIYTFLVILFGEIIPKNFGEKYSVKYGLAISSSLLFLIKILSPLLFTLDKINKLIFPEDKNTFNTSEEEIRMMVELCGQEKSIEKDERELIENVFKLNDKRAEDIMTPRVNIDYLEAGESIESQKTKIFATTHSRLIVVGEDADDVKGFVLLRNMLTALAKNQDSKKPIDFVNPIPTVREKMRVDNLLVYFQRKHNHIALVVDDFGGTSGIVTLEDALEEIVGEIVDETDKQIDMRDVEMQEEDNYKT